LKFINSINTWCKLNTKTGRMRASMLCNSLTQQELRSNLVHTRLLIASLIMRDHAKGLEILLNIDPEITLDFRVSFNNGEPKTLIEICLEHYAFGCYVLICRRPELQTLINYMIYQQIQLSSWTSSFLPLLLVSQNFTTKIVDSSCVLYNQYRKHPNTFRARWRKIWFREQDRTNATRLFCIIQLLNKQFLIVVSEK